MDDDEDGAQRAEGVEQDTQDQQHQAPSRACERQLRQLVLLLPGEEEGNERDEVAVAVLLNRLPAKEQLFEGRPVGDGQQEHSNPHRKPTRQAHPPSPDPDFCHGLRV